MKNKKFTATKEKKLYAAKLLVKNREKIISNYLIKFKKYYFKSKDINSSIFSTKKDNTRSYNR